MGIGLKRAEERFLCAAALVLVPLVSLVACVTEPLPPDMSAREAFARTVLAAALSGTVEEVEKLVPEDRVNVRPEAQQLVDSFRGWAPGSWQIGLSNDFPEVASVEASQKGQAATVDYTISWSNGRWGLVIGTSKNRPTGGAGPGPGNGSGLKAPLVEPATVPATDAGTGAGTVPPGCHDAGYGQSGTAGPLECGSFTSTSANAPGQNLYWLTSTPLHMSFNRLGGSLTMVVQMPCGVLTVPVTIDSFGLTPDPAAMAESADGCAGPAAEYRTWTTGYFRSPSIYTLDAQSLVLANELGRIRFQRD